MFLRKWENKVVKNKECRGRIRTTKNVNEEWVKSSCLILHIPLEPPLGIFFLLLSYGIIRSWGKKRLRKMHAGKANLLLFLHLIFCPIMIKTVSHYNGRAMRYGLWQLLQRCNAGLKWLLMLIHVLVPNIFIKKIIWWREVDDEISLFSKTRVGLNLFFFLQMACMCPNK